MRGSLLPAPLRLRVLLGTACTSSPALCPALVLLFPVFGSFLTLHPGRRRISTARLLGFARELLGFRAAARGGFGASPSSNASRSCAGGDLRVGDVHLDLGLCEQWLGVIFPPVCFLCYVAGFLLRLAWGFLHPFPG